MLASIYSFLIKQTFPSVAPYGTQLWGSCKNLRLGKTVEHIEVSYSQVMLPASRMLVALSSE